MVRVWDAFYAIGPWVGVLVPVVVWVAAALAQALRRYAPLVVDLVSTGLVAVSLTLTLALTMAPGGQSDTRLPWNFDPLPTLRVIVTGDPSQYGSRMDALGNLLLILPLGTFLALIAGRRATLLLVPAVAVSLETTQWLMATGRTPEVADILLNTLGGMVGVLLAEVAARVTGEPLPSTT